MKKLMFVFMVLASLLYADDFSEGMKAVNNGNYKKAFELFQKVANDGDVTAQYNLGLMYYNGDGVRQSYIEAVKWYRKAANQGYVYAQYNLGVMYYNGQGVRQSYRVI